MHKYIKILTAVFCMPWFFIGCKNHTPGVKIISVKETNYPSGSGLGFYKEKIYLVGDDASQLWIMDTALKVIDSMNVYDSSLHRIPAQVKPDYEDMSMFKKGEEVFFFLPGSGTGSNRNSALIINAGNLQMNKFKLDSFYERLKFNGIKNINIEGATALPGRMLLSNRGNKGYRKNFLIFVNNQFWLKPGSVDFKISLAGINKDTSVFNGISGLEYAPKSDKLLLTVSTENTYSNVTDGAIGKSYLWLINDISAKVNFSAINPNIIIDLDAADVRFKGHKIEAVTILEENKKNMKLLLVSDDDDGKSILFVVILSL